VSDPIPKVLRPLSREFLKTAGCSTAMIFLSATSKAGAEPGLSMVVMELYAKNSK
jgi:hypothetical protein